jgi:hypothetical protein
VVWVKGILKVQVTTRGGEGELALAHLVDVKAMEAWRQVMHFRSDIDLILPMLAQPDFSHRIGLAILELSVGFFISPGYQIAWGCKCHD